MLEAPEQQGRIAHSGLLCSFLCCDFCFYVYDVCGILYLYLSSESENESGPRGIFHATWIGPFLLTWTYHEIEIDDGKRNERSDGHSLLKQ